MISALAAITRRAPRTSSCNRASNAGRLPSRLQVLLVRGARRVIAASADITDDEIAYLRSLMEADTPVHLIRNTYVPRGYPVEMATSPDEAPAISRLLDALERGQNVFVATDSLQTSKALAQLLQGWHETGQKLNYLVVNSETSGGEVEAEFIRNVNHEVKAYDCVVATPSLTTGISIDVEHFDIAIGIFKGVLNDADIAQALARVRPAIPRLVWCAAVGKRFNKVSRSDSPLRVKHAIQTQWDRETRLIRTSLRPDISPLLREEYDWDENPHLNHWCKLVARHSFSLWTLRDNVAARLRAEGSSVEFLEPEPEHATAQTVYREARAQAKQQRCETIAAARILTPAELKAISKQDTRTHQNVLDEQKTKLAEFYGLDEVTPELVALDERGRLRGQLIELEALREGMEYSIRRDREALERQAQWQQGLFLPDQPCTELRRFVRDQLGLLPYLNPELEWSDEDLAPLGDCARTYASEIKQHLGVTIPAKGVKGVSNGWILRRLLLQLGIAVTSRRVGPRGQQVKYYRIERERWQFVSEVLARRQARRQQDVPVETVATPLDLELIPKGVTTEMENEVSPSETVQVGQRVECEGRTGAWIVELLGTTFGFIRQVGGDFIDMVPKDRLMDLRPSGASQ
ncbi:MAG: plasmid replication protein, CyRepA1 family [Cyanobacteria bacterium P01_D01_bin.123]